MSGRSRVAVGLALAFALVGATIAVIAIGSPGGPTADESGESEAQRPEPLPLPEDAPPPALLGGSPLRARSEPARDDVPPAPLPPFSGQVLDPDGRPLAGAVVRVAGSAQSAAGATTDEDGRFVLERPTGSDDALVVSAPGLVDLVVPAGSVTAGMRLSFAKGATISGTVRDAATGAAVVGVDVVARPSASPDSPDAAVGTWREDGSFVVAVAGPGTYLLDLGTRAVYRVGAGADDWIPVRVEGVRAGTTDLRVELTRGLSIEGSIVDDAGDPVARAVTVDAVGRTPTGDPDYTVRKFVHVAAGGALRVPGLRPGRYVLWVRPSPDPADAGGAQVSATVVRDVEAGARGLLVRLVRGVALVGRLEDGHGQPVLGAGYVYAYREGERGRGHPVAGDVAGDGTFRVGPLDETVRYDLLATGFEGRKQGVTSRVAARDAGVVVVLEGGGRIAGRVETEDGKPVLGGVPVGVMGEGVGPAAPGARTFAYTAADGTFVADGLAEVAFSVQAGGGRSGYLGTLATGIATGTTDLVLRVLVGVELSGTLVDDKGDPVATTSLQADDGARVAAMRPFAQVGSDGKFVLRGLRAGRVRLSALVGEAWVPLGEASAPGTDAKVVVPAR